MFRTSACCRGASHLLTRFFRNEGGATTIEYALIVGIIGGILIVSFQEIGGILSDDIFGAAMDALNEVTGGG
ncbi:Flp family type IVb pilin [Labrenzia sp. 011]|uniref:Flp family type IVb pilin n=1 Tax=Labrenzia sp. 011 TaxID=2171494 RepID=UPI000D506A97|nr:Flp family type IVb pilin [Labrenzia sp. 011]PVB61553.1 Flp family type IVb pilin [Labrenzia sp. 011]